MLKSERRTDSPFWIFLMSALVIFDIIDSEKSNYLILRKPIRDMKMEGNLIISIPNVKKKIKLNKPTFLVKKVLIF